MSNNDQTVHSVADQLRSYVTEEDIEGLSSLLDPLPRSEALRELLNLPSQERDAALSMIPAELAAEFIEEAPTELAGDLIERLEARRAAEIIEALDSDVQADVIGELDDTDAEAILSNMDAEDVADVRRLIEYDDETAGGLMVAEAFTFGENDTVGAVLKGLASEDDDFERYRGQHPYIIDANGAPIGVVSLRGLLTSRRSAKLTEIMSVPQTVQVTTPLEQLQDVFDEKPYLGLPVVEADGRLVGVVSRAAVNEAALERAESESLKLQGVIGEELRSMPLWSSPLQVVHQLG